MSEWQEVKLANLCVKKGVQTGPFGSQLHQKDYVAVGTPIITVEHLGDNRITKQNLPRISNQDKERLIKYTLQEGDIVFSRVGSVDRRAYVHKEEEGWLFSGRCLRVRVDRNLIDPYYLSAYFGLPSFKEYIRSIAVGATMPSLNTSLLEGVSVIVPPKKQQKFISDIAYAIEAKIELNQRMNETLEGMARAIFKSWFVDFDPVHAKAEGLAPEGMNAQTAALFPDSFTDEGIPEGWKKRPISEIGDVITGKTPSTKDVENYGDQIPFITIPDMHNKIYVLACGKYLSSKGASTQKNKTLPVGSICVSCIATPGLTILTHEECQTNQQINAVVPFKKGLKNFRFWQIKEVSEEVISKGSGGSVFHNLNKSQFSDLRVIEPSFELVKAYEEIVSPFMEKILENEKQNQTLTALRDTLLPKLISGELRIDTTQTDLKEAI